MGEGAVSAISTTGLRETEKFDFFCDAICDVYTGIRPERSTERSFDAAFTSRDLGDTVLATIEAPGHTATRSRALVATRPDDSLFLNMNTRSGFRVSHVGGQWRRPASMPFLLDNREPFRLDFDPSRRMGLTSLRIDSARLGLTPASLKALNDRIAGTATGRQLGMQLRLLSEAADPEIATLMSAPVVALLRALLAETDVESSDLKSVARTHLTDPDFGVEELARLFRCSARTVQSRFAAEGETFSVWLLAERLEHARGLIQAPGSSGRSIESLALASGFRDLSHFHRAFRARFSATPGAFRP